MAGHPNNNSAAFASAASDLRQRGFVVWNPVEHTVDGNTYRDAMARDLPALLRSDAVVVIGAWRQSRGCAIEVAVARGCDIPVLDATTLEPVGHVGAKLQLPRSVILNGMMFESQWVVMFPVEGVSIRHAALRGIAVPDVAPGVFGVAINSLSGKRCRVLLVSADAVEVSGG